MKKLACVVFLFASSLVAQVQLGRNVQIGGAGGGGGCVLTGVPGHSVIFSPDGTSCAGDAKFTFNPDFSAGRVNINGGAVLQIDGVDDSNNTYMNGDQITLTNHGESPFLQTAVTVNLDETTYTGTGTGPLAYLAFFEVSKAGHVGTGFLTQPNVGGIAAGTITGFQSGAPNLGGGTLNKFHGFNAVDGGANALTEDFAFFSNPVQTSSIQSNYCDFMAKTRGDLVTRASITCGPSAASTFGGPVTVNDGSGKAGAVHLAVGTAPTLAAGTAVLSTDTVTGNGMLSENGAALSRICTAANGICAGGGGNTTSTSLTTSKLPKANGANSIIDSSVTDNGTTVSTTEPVQAPSFTGIGSDPYVTLPSNPTTAALAGKLYNNAGVLTFCDATPTCTAISGGMQRLAQVVVSSPVASITFSSIPAGYTNLKLIGSVASTLGVGTTYIEFNGDTAAHYTFSYSYGGGAAGNIPSSPAGLIVPTATAFSFLSAASDTGYFASIDATIPNYSSTVHNKTAISFNARHDPGVDGVVGLNEVAWNQTAAITSITIGAPGTTFVVGSTITLYGE